MNRRKFKGDDEYRLPAHQIEPYRLWFEFLKLAKRDPSIKIKSSIYRSWGNIEEADFRIWWEDNWRKLFAVDIGCPGSAPVGQILTLRNGGFLGHRSH